MPRIENELQSKTLNCKTYFHRSSDSICLRSVVLDISLFDHSAPHEAIQSLGAILNDPVRVVVNLHWIIFEKILIRLNWRFRVMNSLWYIPSWLEFRACTDTISSQETLQNFQQSIYLFTWLLRWLSILWTVHTVVFLLLWQIALYHQYIKQDAS